MWPINPYEYGTEEYIATHNNILMSENIKSCKQAPRFVANMLIRAEKGQLHLYHTAASLIMWGLGNSARGTSIVDRIPWMIQNNLTVSETIYHDIKTEKILHYTIIRQMRRHKEMALTVLEWMKQPTNWCPEAFGGREEMFQFVKRVRRELELPAF
jgi:hypothetical protein